MGPAPGPWDHEGTTAVSSLLSGNHVLVAGGAGFVGSNLCRRILAEGVTAVTIVDNLLSADIVNVSDDPRVRFIEGSIADDRLLHEVGRDFDLVFHLATYHGNQTSIVNPIADHQNNTLTTLKLFEWLAGAPSIRSVVYASAGCTVAEKTFDGASGTREDAPVSLYHDSPYQISKLIGEFYGNYFWKQHGLPVVKARFQNVYGPREILGAGRWRGHPATVWRNVVPTFVYRSLAKEALPLENGGVATRDFIYVDDIVDGLVGCALAGSPGEVYNLASGVETSIGQLAETINELTGNPIPPIIAPARDWDRSGQRYGNVEKAAAELGFVAQTPLRDGLGRTIDWTRENLGVIERCMQQHSRYVDMTRPQQVP